MSAPATALSYPWKHLIAGHLGRLGTRDDVTLHLVGAARVTGNHEAEERHGYAVDAGDTRVGHLAVESFEVDARAAATLVQQLLELDKQTRVAAVHATG